MFRFSDSIGIGFLNMEWVVFYVSNPTCSHSLHTDLRLRGTYSPLSTAPESA